MNNYIFELNGNNITDYIVSFNYSEDLKDVASHFGFTSLVDYGLTSENKLNSIKVIDAVTNDVAYFGYVTDYEHTTDENVYSYTGFDVGFYLNKNEVIKQFDNANIGEAIDSLCSEYVVDIGVRPDFVNSVSKIYKDYTFSDVLKELIELERTKGGNNDLYIDCKDGKLNIRKYQFEADLSSMIANNLKIDSTKTINNASYKISIQDLKNKVIYSNNDEKSVYKIEQIKQESIDKYGLLTSVETVDTNKNNNLSQLATNKLDELNKEKEEISFSMLGNYKISKGKIIQPNISEYNLIDTYLINKVSHTIDEKKEVVNMTVTKYER